VSFTYRLKSTGETSTPWAAREIGLRHRNQSAKAEILTRTVGNTVGIGRGPGANRREGVYHSLARRGKGHAREREREVRETVVLRAPRGPASGSPDIRWTW
jgi:hypothetical protein